MIRSTSGRRSPRIILLAALALLVSAPARPQSGADEIASYAGRNGRRSSAVSW